MEIPVWQIVLLIICGLVGLVSIMSQFIIAQLIKRMNRHSDKIDEHQSKIVILEEIAKSHEKEFLKINEVFINGLNELKQLMKIQESETRGIDKKFTEFVIDFYKNKKRQL